MNRLNWIVVCFFCVATLAGAPCLGQSMAQPGAQPEAQPGAQSGKQAGAQETVKIAAIYAKSGEAARDNLELFQAVRFAVDEENAKVGPGGYDQALVLGELFRKNGFRIVAPSRPGYLGTPLRYGKSADEQGDCMAAQLDALQIPRALVVIDGISCNYTKGDDINKLEEWMYLSKPGQWLTGFFFKHFPAAVVKSFLQTESTLDTHEIGLRVKEILADQGKYTLVEAMFRTMTTRFGERKAGAENDIALGSAIDRLPLDKIGCATLLIHGDADNDVPARDAEYAHESIAGSELLWINQASHIGFWTAEDAYKVQKYTLDWLRKAAA